MDTHEHAHPIIIIIILASDYETKGNGHLTCSEGFLASGELSTGIMVPVHDGHIRQWLQVSVWQIGKVTFMDHRESDGLEGS